MTAQPVTVTIVDRAKNLCSYVGTPTAAGHRRWELNQPLTGAELRAAGFDGGVLPTRVGVPPSQRRGPTVRGDVVHLADGVDVRQADLSVVLDAVASTKQRGKILELDIADLNCIVSQLGSDIAKFPSLPAEQRRIAEPALYGVILQRCSRL